MRMKRGKKKNKKNEKVTQEITTEDLMCDLRLLRGGTPEGYIELESYPLNPPFAYAFIVQSKETAEYLYIADELPLTPEERDAFKRLKNILGYELKAPNPEETLIDSFHKQVPEILDRNQKLLGGITVIKGKTTADTTFTAVPFYVLANREKSSQAVWLRQKDKKEETSSWDNLLYRQFSPSAVIK